MHFPAAGAQPPPGCVSPLAIRRILSRLGLDRGRHPIRLAAQDQPDRAVAAQVIPTP